MVLARKLEFPQLQFPNIVVFPVAAQRQIPTVFGNHRLPYIWWSMSLLCSSTSLSWR